MQSISPCNLYDCGMLQEFVKNLLALVRMKQWVKNLLLLLPFVTSGSPLSVEAFLKGLGGVFFFSIVASFAYIINDFRDRKIDAFHPQKRSRVLASSSFNAFQFLLIYAFLLISLLSLAYANSLGAKFYLTVLAYFVLTNLYTIYFKKIPLVEMFFVASGFVLRVVAGGLLFGITISSWLLLVTAASSMFLVSLKRLAELNSPLHASHKRVVLMKYNLQFLNAISIGFFTIAIMAYCLWAFTSVEFSIYTQLSTIPFTFALMRLFLESAKLEDLGLEDIILRDFSMFLSGLLLITSVFLGVQIK